jgi:hypothetical protein
MAELEPVFLEDPAEISGLELRQPFSIFQEGVDSRAVGGATALKVTTGAGLSVDVAAGVGFVQGDAVTDQGLYRIRNDAAKNSAAFELGGITPNGSANPRIDKIVARLLDHSHDNLGQRKWRLEVVTGAAHNLATLDVQWGAAAVPPSCLLLADVLVPGNNPASIPSGNIRDRRAWARGFFRLAQIIAGDVTVSGTTYGSGGTALTETLTRVEVSPNNALRIRAACRVETPASGGGTNVFLAATVDGVVTPANDGQGVGHSNTGTHMLGSVFEWVLYPTAGSRLIQLATRVLVQSGAVIRANGNQPLIWTIEEVPRLSAVNT